MKSLSFVFTLFFSINLIAQNTTVTGRIISSKTCEPISFASVVCLNESKIGTCADSCGFFSISVKDEKYLIISAIGFQDLKMDLDHKNICNLIIELDEENYALKEVIVSNKRIKKQYKGIPFGEVIKRDGIAYGFPSVNAGFCHGVHINVQKKEIGSIVKTLYVYVTDEGNFKNPFIIRFLGCKKKMYANKNENSINFFDMCINPIFFEAKKSGWHTIDLSKFDIQMKASDALVMFIPIEDDEVGHWKNADGSWFGAVIGTYETKKVKNVARAIKIDDSFVYLKAPNQINVVPAIAVELIN